MAVTITGRQHGNVRVPDGVRVAPRHLRRAVARALTAVGRPGADVEVHVVDDHEMRRLNRVFRGVRRRTDVLAFPVEVPGAAAGLLGQIVISGDTAQRQARRVGVPFATEMALLATHGVLHLVGWDDRDPVEADLMHRREREVLSAGRRLPRKLWTGLLHKAREVPRRGARASLDAPHLDPAHPRGFRASLDAPNLDPAHPRRSRSRGPRYK